MLLLALAMNTRADAATFTLTITNTGALPWDEGVLAVQSQYAYQRAMLPTGPRPMDGHQLDSYAYASRACDLSSIDDDGDAVLLASKWSCPTCTGSEDDPEIPGLIVRVPALAAGAHADVTFNATLGVLSFIARVSGSDDDVVMMHHATDPNDTTVDLFNEFGAPLADVAFELDYYDVSTSDFGDASGANCDVVCPNDALTVIGVDDTGFDPPLLDLACFIAQGGTVDLPPQPTRGGCPTKAHYFDLDGDGNAGTTELSCLEPEEVVLPGNDCNDLDATVGGPVVPAWVDADGDGYGTGSSTLVCAMGVGYATKGGDCDDVRSGVHPGAVEVCGGFDDDCDGLIDAADPGFDDDAGLKWYADTDKDTYGDANAVQIACTQPAGFVLGSTDCDDKDGTTHPGAKEVCGGGDDDCDTLLDDADPGLDASTAFRWYADADKDGHGTPDDDRIACVSGPGFVSDDLDCDDTNADVFSGAPELCDLADNDCDQEIDEDATTSAWPDEDDDGWGAGSPIDVCEAPDGYANIDGDCAPTDPAVNPDANEIPGNDVDDDCVDGDAPVETDTDTDTDTDSDTDSDVDTDVPEDTDSDGGRPFVQDSDTAGEVPEVLEGCGCASTRGSALLGVLGLLALRRRRI